MPMTDKLQKALNNPNTIVAEIADILKRDGLNCRDSLSYDTPLIVAARSNNIAIIEHILNTIRNPVEKTNTINSTNKKEETALSTAIVNKNYKIALRLLQEDADPSIYMTAAMMEWLRPFLDYNELKEYGDLDREDLDKKAKAETEIGARYYHEMGDVIEALKWFELAANDGSKQAMLSLASIYQKGEGDISRAVFWLKKSYKLLTDPKNREAVVSQLNKIAELTTENAEAAYSANMTLGYIAALNADISLALHYFKNAENGYIQLHDKNEQDQLLFNACSFWNGSSFDRQITANDYLDVSKRFEWLVHVNSEESQALLIGFAGLSESPIDQLVACYIGKLNGILTEEQQQPLVINENEVIMQALSTLYGWDMQPKNTLRAAGFFKKIAEANKDKNPTLAAVCYALIAFAYFQQEREQEAYFSEAFTALIQSYDYLFVMKTPARREIIMTIIDAISYVNEEILTAYMEALIHCYVHEVELTHIDNMKQITDRIISIADHIEPYLLMMIDTVVRSYKSNKTSSIKTSTLAFLEQLKEFVPCDEDKKGVLEEAITECSHVEEIVQLNRVDESVEQIDDYAEPVVDEGVDQVVSILIRAQEQLKKRNYDDALKLFTQVYEETGSIEALYKVAHIETELGFYEEAIAHFAQLSEVEEQEISKVVSALTDLKRISEELIERDKRREAIQEIGKVMLLHVLSGDTSYINTFVELNELESYCDFAKHDADISIKLQEIRDRITPFELERMAREKEEEERLRFYKMLEGQGRSAEHRLVTLFSLIETEQANEERIKLIRNAINRLIESVIKIDQGKIFIKNENLLIKLAKQGYLLAAYYLARYHEQNSNPIGALSLYARIVMSSDKDENDIKIQNQSRKFVQNYKKPEEVSITKLFSKQPKTSDYASDLLEVMNTPSTFDDPDTAIQAGLHEKATSIDSYNHYNVSISTILGSHDDHS